MRLMKLLFVSAACVFFLGSSAQAQVFVRQEFYFPQLVDGKSGDNDDFNTIITLNNPNSDVARGTLEIFSSAGTPLIIKFQDLFGNMIELAKIQFTIPARGLFQIKTAGTLGETVVGYGKVTSDKPISGGLVFMEENSPGGFIESQAGVMATGVVQEFAVTDFRNGSDTGLAMVNTENTTTEITLTEYDPAGNLLDQVKFMLGPFQHTAFFFSERLTRVPAGLKVGAVTVRSSNAKVAAIALKFDDGAAVDEFTATPIIQTN